MKALIVGLKEENGFNDKYDINIHYTLGTVVDFPNERIEEIQAKEKAEKIKLIEIINDENFLEIENNQPPTDDKSNHLKQKKKTEEGTE